MDHKRSFNKLQRKPDERKALINGLLTELFRFQRIKTTLPKAKELRRYADKIVTQAKKGTLNNRRNVLKKIHTKEVVADIFNTLPARYSDRNGGYTRVLKLGRRLGDNAPMAIIELMDIPDYDKIEKKKKVKKKPLSKTAKHPVYPGKKKKAKKA